MSAQLKHEPRIHLRRRVTPAVVSTSVPEKSALDLVIEDLNKGRTHGLKQYFTNHCRNPSKMRPRTLWYLMLLRLRYERQPAYYSLRMEALKDILSQVPERIKAQVRAPDHADLKESQT